VPKKVFVLEDPEIEVLSGDQCEVIGEKVSHRLAQLPGSYLVLEYRCLVYKRLNDDKIVTTPAPANGLEKSAVDVSLLAGMLIDKFVYNFPLYRQHQRLQQAWIEVSRTSLSNWTSRLIDLLRPIVDAQYEHILLSNILAMDETPIKVGRQKKGKMRQAYLWPIYGENDEIVFATHHREHIAMCRTG
jgi:transposase